MAIQFLNTVQVDTDVLYVDTSSNRVGIGTTSPGAKLDIRTDSGVVIKGETGSTNAKLKFLPASGGRQYNFENDSSSFQIVDASAGSTRMYFHYNGNLGIGTTSPGNTLHVYKNATIGLLTSPTVANAGFRVQDSGANMYVDGNSFVIDTAGYLTTTGSNDFDIGTNSTSRIKILGNGNVGIGTTSPADKLEVNGNLSIFGNKIYNGSASNSAGVSFPGSTTRIDGYNGITFHSSTTTVGSQSERMRITNAGNVGIGTTSPGAKLHIQSGNISTNEVNVIKLSNTVGVGGGPSIFFKTSGADADNRYGVKLGARRSDSDNGSSVFKIQQELDNGSGTLIGLQDVFTINQYGNVGIGTTSPQSKLQINDGSINVTKAMQSGGVDHDFLQLSYAGSWGNNIGGLASINFTDNLSSSNTVGRIGVTYTGSQGKFVVTDLYSGGYGGSGDVFTIQADGQTYIKGNVGIGTTNPTEKLHVDSIGTNYVARFRHSTGTGYAPGSILLEAGQSDSRGQGVYHYNNVADENWFTGVPYSVHSKKWIVANKYSTIQDVDTAQLTHALMTIDSDTGNVGIGTTNPSRTLSVEGTAFVRDDFAITVTDPGTNLRKDSQLYLQSKGNQAGTVRSSQWFLQTESDSVYGNSGLSISKGYDGGSASEYLRILSSGNVGIGTTSPAQKLDVAGNVVIPYGNAYFMDTVGVGASNFLKTINSFESVVGTDRGSAGFGVFGNSNIRLGFGTSYTAAQTKLTIIPNGSIQFNAYNSTNKTGTPTYLLGTDASGNVVKTNTVPGSGAGPYLPLSAGSSYPLTGALHFGDAFNYIEKNSSSDMLVVANRHITFSDVISGVVNERMRIEEGGNVGINVTNPLAKLHVLGSVILDSHSTTDPDTISRNAYSAAQMFTHYDEANGVSIIGGEGGFNGTGLTIGEETGRSSGFKFIRGVSDTNGGGNAAEEFWINGIGGAYFAGNVGIGTDNPLYKIHSSNSGSRNDLQFTLDSFGTGSTNGAQLGIQAGGAYIWNFENNDLYFATNNSRVLTIKPSGNVGIGTTNPAQDFVVADTTNGNGIELVPGTTATIQTYNRGTSSYNNLNLDVARLLIRSFDYTTINTGSALTERMRIDSSGNVGIGTTSPNYKLSVSGGIQAGGVVTYSKVASSLDTTGFAIAGLGTAFNGSSAGFTFTAYGGTGKYQKVVYSCYGSGTTWYVKKVIDEGTNTFDIAASASSAATIAFTFKTRSGSQGYSPRVVIEATGHSIISTYA